MNWGSDNEIKETIKFLRLNYSDEKLPVFKENKGKEICYYGEKNDYPEKLIELYNRSPKHNAIVTKKTKFIIGKETIIESAPEKVLKWNKYDSVVDFKYKIGLDKKIFGAYSVEVLYDKLGKPNFYHIPVDKVRTLDHESYQYWPNGAATKQSEIKYYEPYDLNNKTKDENGNYNKQLIYRREYRAGLGVYALPDYIGALAYVQIDTRIANFHLSNIRNGFTGGTLIQMFKGEPTPEEARGTEKAFKKRYGGDDATDTGGLIFQFNEANEKEAIITPLAPNDLDNRFLQLNNHVQQEIFVGHGVTSPMLFGVRVEGQLGGRNELKEAYEIYYRDVIEPEQVEMDSFLTECLNDMGIKGEVVTVKAEPVGQDWAELYTLGLVSKQVAQENLGVPVEPILPQPSTFSKENQFDESEIEIFAQFGELESDYELLTFAFAELSEKEIKVMSAINSNEKATVEEIGKATRIDTTEVEKILKKLDSSGKIKWTNKAIKITDLGKKSAKDLDTLVMRYKYQVSPEAAPLKTSSRPFCQKLMDLGRVYSREDIDLLSAKLGYDVWQKRGGWYHDPVKDVNLPHCRHEWRQVILRRKNK